MHRNDWAGVGCPTRSSVPSIKSSREDASGPVPDDGIPGGMQYTAELRDGQCDECEEDQGVGSLCRAARKDGW